jgi:hypothetical protein
LAYFNDNNSFPNGLIGKTSNSNNGRFEPLREIEFSYNASGISHNLLIDFGEFSLSSDAVDIIPLPQPHCP